MTILLFGVTKDIIGSATLSMPSSSEFGSKKSKTVKELKDYLGKMYPELKKLSSLAVAVNNSYANDDTIIDNFDEIALIPPVSGG
ncbi:MULTISPECIES: MoaD/ThiS family protein [Arenibacter]|jgi:molybdopterin synthase sulfur carrier subunit|uniref:MoaD/ThiS family protein n=1 Tax=Arenibacter TaxID=178469 RepID=UPI0004DEF380|nr:MULTISPECIES: MoaD/ThiS family protein [Arenibacter]MCM4163174.1 MoaD/ThiS family protein [Arenibacter sp. A80]RFT57199.1 MoaD/ThiS family protein [Arenibacter sp. P308M17]GBF22307.1 molybdopterin synthase sulfur carrier subunit [Arenibacter sp. NBRC 103722]|tara:strand:+ start:225 stop:479 length:255 start_codon:yes stop_codon:yes gene_type:complete